MAKFTREREKSVMRRRRCWAVTIINMQIYSVTGARNPTRTYWEECDLRGATDRNRRLTLPHAFATLARLLTLFTHYIPKIGLDREDSCVNCVKT